MLLAVIPAPTIQSEQRIALQAQPCSSFDLQRTNAILCLLYGADKAKYQRIVGDRIGPPKAYWMVPASRSTATGGRRG